MDVDTDDPLAKSYVDTNFNSGCNNLDILRRNMIERIAKSDAHFKHQQRDEPDLQFNEKCEIADGILKTNTALFLSRFGSYLLPEDLPFFAEYRSSYEVQFYLREIEKQHDNVFKKKVINNRRYAAMQELMMGGEYFSEEEMKWRDPWLYNEMVGQYLTEDDIKAKVDKSDLRFSSVLLKHMDQLRENAWYEVLKEKEEGQKEEEDSDGEEEKDEKEEKECDSSDESKPKISETEKNILRSEFLQIMQERFMTGNDKTFDYNKVDKNTYYDNLETLGKDEEERYFDDDDDDNDANDSCMVVDNILPERGSNKVSVVEDYMKYHCEPICEATVAAEQLTKMTVSNCDVIKDLFRDSESETITEVEKFTKVTVSKSNSYADNCELVKDVFSGGGSETVAEVKKLTKTTVTKSDSCADSFEMEKDLPRGDAGEKTEDISANQFVTKCDTMDSGKIEQDLPNVDQSEFG